MTRTAADPSPADVDAPVTIATYPNPYEAELAHAALESQGIRAVVLNDHGQYLSAASWVHLQVARGDRERAVALLERGPLHGVPESDEPAAGDAPDDLTPLRWRRRILLGRWFLFAGAVAFLFSVWLVPLSAVALALALWSRWEPRRAFAVAFGLQSLVVVVSVAISGLQGLTAVLPLVAFYLAWDSAGPSPRVSLVTGSAPHTRGIPIGDAWRTDPVDTGATSSPRWFFRDLGWLLLAFAIVGALAIAIRVG